MKALVGAFNQEKALVGAFSVIVQPVVEPMDRLTALILNILIMPCGGNHIPNHVLAQKLLTMVLIVAKG